MVKNKKVKKTDSKYCVITSVNLNIGWDILEQGKSYTMDEKSLEFIKTTLSFQKWRVKMTKLD